MLRQPLWENREKRAPATPNPPPFSSQQVVSPCQDVSSDRIGHGENALLSWDHAQGFYFYFFHLLIFSHYLPNSSDNCICLFIYLFFNKGKATLG